MRIVVDTNIFISAIFFNKLPETLIKHLLLSEHKIISSPYIITEINKVARQKFNAKPPTLRLLGETLKNCEIVYFEPFLNVLEDTDDNRILETAVIGQAQFVVTGDKPLLALKSYKSIQVININQCAELLDLA